MCFDQYCICRPTPTRTYKCICIHTSYFDCLILSFDLTVEQWCMMYGVDQYWCFNLIFFSVCINPTAVINISMYNYVVNQLVIIQSYCTLYYFDHSVLHCREICSMLYFAIKYVLIHVYKYVSLNLYFGAMHKLACAYMRYAYSPPVLFLPSL